MQVCVRSQDRKPPHISFAAVAVDLLHEGHVSREQAKQTAQSVDILLAESE